MATFPWAPATLWQPLGQREGSPTSAASLAPCTAVALTARSTARATRATWTSQLRVLSGQPPLAQHHPPTPRSLCGPRLDVTGLHNQEREGRAGPDLGNDGIEAWISFHIGGHQEEMAPEQDLAEP